MIEKDHTKILEICTMMRGAVQRMHESADDTGSAVWLIKTGPKSMDHLLAKYIKTTHAFQGNGKPRAMRDREIEAMTNPDYLAEYNVLSDGLKDAYKLVKRWEVNDKAFEGNRSMLSLSKRIADDLMG